jgi:hypothetical protein
MPPARGQGEQSFYPATPVHHNFPAPREDLTFHPGASLMRTGKGGGLMNIAIRPGAITFEDFCRIVREDQKADLIDGVIYMASPENTDANELFVWLCSVLGIFVRKRKLAKV